MNVIIRALLAVSLLVPALTVRAEVIHVPTDQPTVAAALAAAKQGDTISLAPGIYPEHELQVPVGVILRGEGNTPGETVIDAGGQGRILLLESLPDLTLITNLTLRNAMAVGKSSYSQSGGAVFVSRSEVRIENCVFVNNRADSHGGAIRISAASPVIIDCLFQGNQAPNGGGGAIESSFDSFAQIINCVFENNTALWGGALSFRMGGGASLQFSTLTGNTATGEMGYGGAVFADSHSVVSVVQVVMADNHARYGGAVACFANSAINLDRVTITDNTAIVLAGGMLVVDAAPLVSNSIIAFNDGAAIDLVGAGAPVITCTNLYGNSRGDWTAPLTELTDMSVNFAVDPLFCSRDPLDPDGLRLQEGSPLLNPGAGCGTLGAYADACGAIPSPAVPSLGPDIDRAMASPNPFNPRTNISFTLNRAQEVEVVVYGLRGERVRVLHEGRLSAGEQVLAWQGRDHAGRAVSSGLYFVVIRGESATSTLKLTMLK